MTEKKVNEEVMENEVQEEKGVSRRNFLVKAGTLAAGTLAFTGLVGCSTETGAGTAEAAELPWEYKKIDVDKVRKLGYENYFKGGCCYAAGSALLIGLRDAAGSDSQWETIPEDMFRYGVGGAYGWGTLCGAANAALLVMNMAVKDHPKLGEELLSWYQKFPFPSDKHEEYCEFQNQITTVANSPLCHVSVTTWVNEVGERVHEKAKADRCAKLSGDTAAKAAEMLNEALDGKIPAAFAPQGDQTTCFSCHQGPDSSLDNQQGKQDCLSCHDDHTK